jgi:AcrR family transcriptional regulator
MKTKDKILQTALTLFNEGNTQSATTNHIAKAMGISPGNLHYHYKNREEIVFKLYEQMKTKTELPVPDLPFSMKTLYDHFNHLAKVYWEYRFFHKELLFLLSKDERLKKVYIKDNLAHKERIKKANLNMVENGYFHIEDQKALNHLVDNILLTTQFWISFLTTLDSKIDQKNVSELFSHLKCTFRPYMTKKAFEELKQFT